MIHNHLENNRVITTKPGLIRSLRHYYSTTESAVQGGYLVYDSIPTSFIITAQCEDLEYRLLTARFGEISNGYSHKERMPAKHCSKNMWLIKPAAMNQGRGIEICRKIKEIKTILASKNMHSVWVVQKYIERPLLFKGRKFDIRIWAVATAKHEFFYYKHGYLRTSSSEYDTQAKDNYVHLTNNCLQKNFDNYGIHEKGNTLSFQDFQMYLEETFGEFRVDFWEHLLPRMKDLMIDTYLSGKKQMHKSKRKLCFELFGFDFMIDEDLRTWLIEVNTNPYLGVPNEYIEEILQNMVDDLLEITVDPHIPPKNPKTRSGNDFELLYCEAGSIFSEDGSAVNTRNSYNSPIYPIPELGQPPMCRNMPQKEEEHFETQKPPVRETLQSLKDIIEAPVVCEVSDFQSITNRIMSQLSNWELMAEEQIESSTKALELLSTSNGLAALVVYGHLKTLVNLCFSENIPKVIQKASFKAICNGVSNTLFRKEIVKLGILHYLIKVLMSENTEKEAFETVLNCLKLICNHPTKNIYIPGETRDHDWIRGRVICEGGLLCLYNLYLNGPEDIKEDLSKYLKSEFGLADWDLLTVAISKTIEGTDSPQVKHKKALEEVRLPNFLDNSVLSFIRDRVVEMSERRREEISNKLQQEKQKKVEEHEEKLRQREEEDRLYEQKKQKVEEYAKLRHEQIRKEKAEEKKKRMQSTQEKFDSERKAALVEKIKKQEEQKRINRIKQKQREEHEKKFKQEIQKEQEERNKKAMEEWLKAKIEKEKEAKLKERKKREKEEARRMIEYEQRKAELEKKLEEKKKLKKEAKKLEESKITDPKIGELSVIEEIQNYEKRVYYASSAKPFKTPQSKEPKLRKKRNFDRKRKLLKMPRKAFSEVYKNKFLHYRSYSKNENSTDRVDKSSAEDRSFSQPPSKHSHKFNL